MRIGTIDRRWLYGALVAWLTGGVVWNVINGISYVMANQTFRVQTGLIGHFSVLGLLFTAALTPFGLTMFLWGILMDKIGPRRSSIIGLAIMIAAEILLANAHTVTILLAGQFLLGIGGGFFFPLTFVVGRIWMAQKERSIFFVLVFSFMSVCALGLSPLAAVFITTIGWNAPFYLYAVLLLGVMCLHVWVFSDRPEIHRRIGPAELARLKDEGTVFEQRVLGKIHDTLAQVMKDSRYWWALILLMANNATTFGYFAWAPSYFVHARHFNLVQAGLIAGIAGVCGTVIFQPLGGWIQDRTGKRAAVAVIGAIGLILAYWVTISVGNDLVSAAVLACCNGAFSGILGAASHTISVNLATPRIVGTAVGIQSTISQTITSFTPTVMGAVIGLFAGSYTAGFYLLMGVSAMGAIAALFLSFGEFRNSRTLFTPQPSTMVSK